jgi:hypothetical protein
MNQTGILIMPISNLVPTILKKQATFQESARGALSKNTLTFLFEGAPEGEWNKRIHKVARDFNQAKYTLDETIEKLSAMTNSNFSGTLDKRDLATIESAFNKDASYDSRFEFPEMIQEKDKWVTKYKSPKNSKYLMTKILGLDVKYNVMKNKVYIGNSPIQDVTLSFIKNRSIEYGLCEAKEYVIDAITELAMENKYHPFKEMVESKTWDGKSRFLELTKTLILENESDLELYNTWLKKWLVAVIAKVYCPGSQNVMLTLKGAQGVGKSRWLRKLCPVESTYVEGGIDPENKDHLLRQLDYIIWNVEELDGVTRKKDSTALKEFLMLKEISVREAYGRYAREGGSIVSFTASVNSEQFLVDQTGNRRYVVLKIVGMDANHNVDMQQLYAECLHLFNDGYIYYYGKEEIDVVNEENEQFEYMTKNDYFSSFIRPGNDWISIQEIVHTTNKSPHPGDYSSMGALLKKKGYPTKRMIKNGTKLTFCQIDLEYYKQQGEK